jgi:HK97 family phage major capsid protein
MERHLAMVAEADPMVVNQATAMAEELVRQFDARIEARLDNQVAAMQREATESYLREVGLVDAEGRAALPSTPPPPPVEGNATRPFARLGDQLQSIRRAASPGASADGRLLEVYGATGMSEGVAADGGYLLQDTFVDDIMRLTHDTGQVFGRITRRYPLGGNSNSIKMPGIDETSRADGSRWGGVRGYWVEEGGTLTASKPTFQRIALELNKIAVLSYATSEQLQDTPVIEGLIRDGFSEEFGFMLDDAAIRGTGVGQPLGILTSSATVSVAKETNQVAATIVFENIVKMWSRLYARSRSNAVWFINQDIEPQLLSMSLAVGTGGVPVYLPANGLSGAPFATLMGRPVVPIEQAATVGTVGDIILADMSQFWAIDKGGANYASSIHVQFLTDETAFRGTYRVDFRPMWLSALTPAQGTNTVSPFVTLATRA